MISLAPTTTTTMLIINVNIVSIIIIMNSRSALIRLQCVLTHRPLAPSYCLLS